MLCTLHSEKLVILMLCLGLLACSPSAKVVDLEFPFQAECLEAQNFEEADYPVPLSEQSYSEALDIHFSLKSITAANAIGAIDELEHIINLSQSETMDTLKYVLARQRLSDKINQASLEISSITASIDCEEEKSEQLASFLEKEIRKKERNFTVAAIVTGAAISVLTGGILFLQGGDLLIELVGITGGLTEVWLGLSILKANKKVAIEHRDNILAEVKEGGAKTTFIPPAIWYYINHENASRNGKSLRQLLLDRWQIYNLDEGDDNVLFMEGGLYSAEMLKNRADMLDQLEAQIDLMQQDLLGLSKEINAL